MYHVRLCFFSPIHNLLSNESQNVYPEVKGTDSSSYLDRLLEFRGLTCKCYPMQWNSPLG